MSVSVGSDEELCLVVSSSGGVVPGGVPREWTVATPDSIDGAVGKRQ